MKDCARPKSSLFKLNAFEINTKFVVITQIIRIFYMSFSLIQSESILDYLKNINIIINFPLCQFIPFGKIPLRILFGFRKRGKMA